MLRGCNILVLNERVTIVSVYRSKLPQMFCISPFAAALSSIDVCYAKEINKKYVFIVHHWFTVTVDDGCNQKHIWSRSVNCVGASKSNGLK